MEDEQITPVEENEDDLTLIEDEVEENAEPQVLKEKLEATKKALHEAIKTKKNWRTKYEEALKSSSDTLPTKPTPPTEVSDLAADVRELKVEKEKRHFAYANQLSPEETDFVFSMPVPTGKKREELLNDPFIKGGLESYRQRKQQESATPRPSSRAMKIAGKSVSDLSDKELRENWGKLTGAEKS